MRSIKVLLKAIRVKSYIKNIFVFTAVFFSNNLSNINIYKNALLAFVAFCFISSAVYLFNDIRDVEKDRLHAIKKDRPIAKGDMSIGVAWVLSCIFFILAIVTSWLVSINCTIIIIIYLAINLLYTFYLKKHSLFDVYAIGIGFVLRVLIGGYAINVEVSNYLLITIFALSLFLGFAKRYSEVKLAAETNISTRESLKHYSLAFLNASLWSMMTLSCLFYALWTIDPVIIANVGSNRLVFTVPIVLIGFLEYLQSLDSNKEGDPIYMILSNKKLIIIVAIFILSVAYIIYF